MQSSALSSKIGPRTDLTLTHGLALEMDIITKAVVLYADRQCTLRSTIPRCINASFYIPENRLNPLTAGVAYIRVFIFY